MFQSTYNDHFQFGRHSEQDGTFIVECGQKLADSKSPVEEAQRSASLIYEYSRDLKIKLCLSGGIDSACMLESFTTQNIPFEALFLKFKNSLNDFDILTNLEFCRQKNIKHSIIDLDILHFFDSGIFIDIAKKYECQSPQIASHLWLLDQIDGLPIIGGNPMMPIWHNQSWFYVGLPGELHCTYFKYFQINQRAGVPWFFLYTPELISSFFNVKVAHDFISKKKTNLHDYNYAQKCLAYQQGGFSALPRKDKFTGFELVRKFYDEKYNTKHGTSFDQNFRRPLENLFPFPESYIQLVPKNYFPNSLNSRNFNSTYRS
jgi:hypothetical protein